MSKPNETTEPIQQAASELMQGLGAMDYIRKSYGVPAKIGGRVRCTGAAVPMEGVIRGAENGRLLVRFDWCPTGRLARLHPTWEIEYL